MLLSRYEKMPFSKIKATKKKRWNAIQIVVLGYISVILFGTILLSLPFAKAEPVRFLDSLFTACSAVCVTGLSVLNIGTAYTHQGHWIILFLMEIGGLGIMTVSTTLILLAGMRPGFNQQSVLLSTFTTENNVDATKILRTIIPFTLLLQLFGTLIYFTQFKELHTYDRFFSSLFHAVSAFCNVGFSLFPDSLMRFQTNTVVNTTTCILVVAGGFGFLAITEMQHLFNLKTREFQRISLHTKIAAFCTLFLIVGGGLILWFTESSTTIKDLSFIDKMLSTFFISISSRTAGLNTIDMATLSLNSIFLVIIMMIIGANPGSCGGGIKTTTAAVIALLGFNRLLGRQKTQVLGRTIPEETVDRAVRIFVIAIVVLVGATLILLHTEAATATIVGEESSVFIKILFEVASAYSTCGLSLGITPQLTDPGRIIICIVMFIGRMGPLFLISAVARQDSESGMWFAEEDIMVG